MTTTIVDKNTATPLAATLLTAKDGDTLTVPGVLTGVTWRTTRQGRHWATATLVDGAEAELLMLPDVYARVCGMVAEGARVEVTARWQDGRLMAEGLIAAKVPADS